MQIFVIKAIYVKDFTFLRVVILVITIFFVTGVCILLCFSNYCLTHRIGNYINRINPVISIGDGDIQILALWSQVGKLVVQSLGLNFV